MTSTGSTSPRHDYLMQADSDLVTQRDCGSKPESDGGSTVSKLQSDRSVPTNGGRPRGEDDMQPHYRARHSALPPGTATIRGWWWPEDRSIGERPHAQLDQRCGRQSFNRSRAASCVAQQAISTADMPGVRVRQRLAGIGVDGGWTAGAVTKRGPVHRTPRSRPGGRPSGSQAPGPA